MRSRTVVAVFAFFVAACSSGSSSSGTTGPLPCEWRGTDGVDSDCIALGLPRKLGCDTAEDMEAALARGCQREDPNEADDYGVCCATTVEGTPVTTQPVDSAVPVTDSGTAPTDTGTAPRDTGSVVDTRPADTKTGLGIGEKCTTESQCRSGICYRPGGTTGFCTTSCSVSFDYKCFGDYEGGDNSLGEYIACMPFAGGGRCYPGCVNGKQASCTPFGLVCRTSQKDVVNYNVAVCLEI